jgi:hypothetical protein
VKLPNGDRAVIDERKLREYLLSESHPVGRFKAVFFRALGYSAALCSRLELDLRQHAQTDDAIPTDATEYGQKYEIRGRLLGPNGKESASCLDCSERRAIPTTHYSISRRTKMRFRELDTVVLDRDLPEQGLRAGDLGAVVSIYPPEGLEVEFVSASGRTEALVTLSSSDVRAVEDRDLIAVRRLERSA